MFELIGKLGRFSSPAFYAQGEESADAQIGYPHTPVRMQLTASKSALPESELISVIGNLLDNAIEAIQRSGAFDYILKPVSWKRLSHSLERFVKFSQQQRVWKVVDQQNVDRLYKLQARNAPLDAGSKGIEKTGTAPVPGG